MSKRAIDKDFDDADVQNSGGPSIESTWSDEARALYGEPRDTAHDVAVWFAGQGIEPVLDVGCGNGVFQRSFGERAWFGLDRSIEQLKQAEGPRMIGDALSLPFAAETFPGVVSLYTLYFFTEPADVVREALRVLRPGGWFATCAPSRFDAPELSHVTPKGEHDSFMAEDIPALMFEHFRDVHVNVWDFPALDLRDRDTVSGYLYSWYYPQLTRAEAAQRAEQVDVPLKLTKRGIWAVGRKP